jgi:Tfp pilus assembly protein PilE
MIGAIRRLMIMRRFLPFRTRLSRGLSSFEILTVVAIMLAVSSVGVVTYRNTRKSLRINSGATELVKVMEVARNMAISQNTYFGVRVDMTGGAFWVDELEIDATATPTRLRILQPKVTTPKKLPNLVRFEQVLVTHSVNRSLLPVTTESATYQGGGFAMIFFAPSGASDGAVIHLFGVNDNAAYDSSFHSVKLYSSTGVAKTFPGMRL